MTDITRGPHDSVTLRVGDMECVVLVDAQARTITVQWQDTEVVHHWRTPEHVDQDAALDARRAELDRREADHYASALDRNEGETRRAAELTSRA